MKTIVKLVVASFFGVLAYGAQANDGIGWSVTVGSPTYFAPQVRHYAPLAVVYYDSPVVVYRQSPQVVVLPNAGFNNFYGNSVYAPQSFTRGARFNHGNAFQGERCQPNAGHRVYHRGNLYGTSGWR